MFDILVNGQVVAIAIESLAKLFVKTLVDALPVEISITTRAHVEPQETLTEPKEKESTAVKKNK